MSMFEKKGIETKYSPSIQYKVNTTLGVAYITLVEKEKGWLECILIHIGKAGTEGNTHADAYQRMLTMLLETHSISKIIGMLSGISNQKVISYNNGRLNTYTYSLPGAIANCLISYRNECDKTEEYTPPKFRLRRA